MTLGLKVPSVYIKVEKGLGKGKVIKRKKTKTLICGYRRHTHAKTNEESRSK